MDGGDGTIKAYKAEFKDNNGAGSSINSDILRFTNGATGANAVETALSLNVLSIQAGPNNSALTSRDLTFMDDNKILPIKLHKVLYSNLQQVKKFNLLLMKSMLVATKLKRLQKVQMILMR